MDLPSIKDLIKDNIVIFHHYRVGNLYMSLRYQPIGDGLQKPTRYFVFPIPIDDIGGATIQSGDKAIYFMRYIRKAIDDKTFIEL